MVVIGFLVMMLFYCDPTVIDLFDRKNSEIRRIWQKKLQDDGTPISTRDRLVPIVAMVEDLLKSIRGIVNVNKDRKTILVNALKEIYANYTETACWEFQRDESFCFLYDLGQSAAYKNLVMKLSLVPNGQSAYLTQQFFNNLIDNSNHWYLELTYALSLSPDAPLTYLINKESSGHEYLELLAALKTEIDTLAKTYPNAIFSKSVFEACRLRQNTPPSPLRNSSE